MLKKLLKSLLRIILLSYVGLIGVLYFMQNDLLFPRKALDEGFALWAHQTFPHAETKVTTLDGTLLHGWFVQRHLREKKPLILYFGGNAEEVTNFLYFYGEHFPQYAIATFNYRGYGLSEGKPSEKNLFQDALFLYDYLSKQSTIDPQRIYVMGRSLGTGVATYLSSQRQLKGTILISPYDSIVAVAQYHYPFMPMHILLEHPFESFKYASQIKTPALAFVGLEDDIIPALYSQRLIDQWKGEIKKVTFPSADHNSIMDEPLLWKSIEEFISVAAKERRD